MPATAFSPLEFIRRHVLDYNQTEMGLALGISQSLWQRYERETLPLPLHHRLRVIEMAETLRLPLSRDWFDAVPYAPGVAKGNDHGSATR